MVPNFAGFPQAQYGAVELKEFYQRRWFFGFLVAVMIHLLVLSAYYLMPAPPVRVTVVPPKGEGITYQPLPPSIGASNLPPAHHPVNASEGIPEPVADPIADPNTTILSQNEYASSPGTGEYGGAAEGEGFREPVIEEPPPDFVYTEKNPVIIHGVKPEYPLLAIRAGLEGTVWVKIWVDKEGKARDAIVTKSDAEIFNEAAVSAAQQFLFTPAYTNSGAVSVWVSLPFRFRLTGER